MEEQEVFVFPFHEDYLPEEQQIPTPEAEDNQINIIRNVLGRLRMEVAIRASFNYRWHPATGLSLSFGQYPKDFPTFADLVERVLSLMTGTISNFEIFVHQFNEEECRLINNFLCQAIGLGATSLNVMNSSNEYKLNLSCDFFSSCHELEQLQLCNFAIKLPELSITLNLPRLVKLDLHSCNFDEGELQRLVACCPNLRILQVSLFSGLGNLDLELPNLQDIRLTGLMTDNISFKYCPQLQKVNIDLYPPSERNYPVNVHPPRGVLHLFHGTCNLIQDLELGRYTLKKLSRSHVPYKLECQFECLKYIMFRMDLGSLAEISVALCILRSSPVLDRLYISADKEFTKENDDLHKFWGTRESLNCTLDRVSDLSIHNLRLEYPHLEFCRFLLANTPILKSFYAEAWINGTDVGGHEIRKQLKSYEQIASPHVDIW